MEIKDADRGFYVSIVVFGGWKSLMEHLEESFPQLDLYSVSQDWYRDKRFILKARGAAGDLIISFK